MDWFLYDRDLRQEKLIKLNDKFTESQNQKILISQLYISIFMGVWNGWKTTLAN